MMRVIFYWGFAFLVALLSISCSFNPPVDTIVTLIDEDDIWTPSTDLFTLQDDGSTLFLFNDKTFKKENGYTFWSQNMNANTPFRDFSTVVKKVSGNLGAGFGVVFRCSEIDGTYYLLTVLINTHGSYTIGKVKDGEYEYIQEWKGSQNLRRGYGVDNLITISYEEQSSVYILSINGQEEQRFMDTKEPCLSGNSCGYVVVIAPNEDFTNSKVEVHFKSM